MMHAMTAYATTIYADPTDDLNAVIDGAGPISFVFVAFLGVALFIIIKSMNKQFRKVNKDLPPGKADRRRAFDEGIIAKAEEAGEKQAEAQGSAPTPPAEDSQA